MMALNVLWATFFFYMIWLSAFYFYATIQIKKATDCHQSSIDSIQEAQIRMDQTESLDATISIWADCEDILSANDRMASYYKSKASRSIEIGWMPWKILTKESK